MKKCLFGLLLAALIVVPIASAGGWATIRMSSLPTDLAAGEPWNLTIRVLQHGNPDTPVEGANPGVTLGNATTGARVVYTARPTEHPGSYRFEIVFPEAGEWSYSIYDGFEEFDGAQTHTYAPVTIEPSPGASASELPRTTTAASDGLRVWPIALGVAVLVPALTLGGLLIRRRNTVAV